jgi:hypothetical protein
MKIHVEKKLPILLLALVCASTLASLPVTKSTWGGVKAVYGEQDFGLRNLREAMLVALTSGHGIQKPVSLDGRISSDGRLVWKTPESLLSACCEIDRKDRS